jgi:hypothetical protein
MEEPISQKLPQSLKTRMTEKTRIIRIMEQTPEVTVPITEAEMARGRIME